MKTTRAKRGPTTMMGAAVARPNSSPGPMVRAAQRGLVPAKLRAGPLQAKPGPSGPKAPRPELLPAKMRGMVGQPSAHRDANPAWKGAPRPELLPRMKPSKLALPRPVAQPRSSRGVVATPSPAGQRRGIGHTMAGPRIGNVGRSKPPAALQRSELSSSEMSEVSQYPSSFEEIAQAAAFSDHTLQWLTGALEAVLPLALESDDFPGALAKAIRHAFKWAVPDPYEGKKMPGIKPQGGEKAAKGYVYGTPNHPKEWQQQANAPTIRAMIQPRIANTSDLVASLKAMNAFVHGQSRSPAKYKYLEGHAAMEIDPILIYIRIPDGPSDTYGDFSYLDAGVYQHVVAGLVPFYYPFGSFHLSVNPLVSSGVISLSDALHEATRAMASQSTTVTADGIANAWYQLCVGG